MGKLKIAFIINPHSGTAEKKELPTLIDQRIDKNKFDVTSVFTEYAGHGKELAAKFAAEGYDAVIACGGDGTINEIASSLTGTGTVFGIVPFGSGNGLARHLHIPLEPADALCTINTYRLQPLDYGVVNDHKFFCTCGAGFDAQIAWEFAQQPTRGLFTYLKLILKGFWRYQPETYIIEADGKIIERKAFVVTFANASQYGNEGYIAPLAETNDGWLDVSIIKPFKWYNVPKLTYQLLTRKLYKNNLLEEFKAKSATLRRKQKGPFHFDGDPVEFGDTINVKIVADALKVIAGE
ncbi:MAG: diacylglycerol kinase family lipid kinase [Paludibacteraceae bacterium]|nr:diacylglycerol kinase family lipid kinase [Paludibacteraceae bacterium]